MVADEIQVANHLTLTQARAVDYPGGPDIILGSLQVEEA